MRMDERLMQVLRAANGALAAAPPAARQPLAATPFAIAPLGPRLGLLQWVGGTVPLFQVLCAAWRHRPCAQ
jgi:serine/threonine-protein kinase SMG1